MELVGRAFGGIFVKELEQLDTGKWTGPVQSGFGWHLVFILERTDADYPPLEEIRSDLVADFDYERRTRAKTEAYEKLKERYEIIIVEPGETSDQ